MWQAQFFPSGSCVVVDVDADPKTQPHLYVYGPSQADRAPMCRNIADFLNGGTRPKWFADLWRRGETSCEDVDRTYIIATGPYIDIDPPNLDWREDLSEQSRRKRKELIDRLLMVEGK